MAVHVGYEGATRCTDGPAPGARAFMAWFLGAYGGRGGRNLGIYNCRSVRGGTTTSLHGEGRAVDFGINPHGAAYGTALAEQLRLHSAELGVQCVIWNRLIWSGSYPHAGWRRYSGVNPHLDHLHVELTRAAARSLTAAHVQRILAPAPPRDWFDMATEADLRRVMLDVLRTPMPRAGDGQTGTTSIWEVARWSDSAIRTARGDTGLVRKLVEALAVKVDALAARTASGDAAISRGEFDDLMRRVLAIEARLVPSDPGGTS
jgi:hypothetical protein